MSLHVELAADRCSDPAVGVDHKGLASVEQQSGSFHAVLFGDGAVGVGQQGNAKLVRVVEPGLYGCVVGADTDSLGAEGGKFDGQVAEMA